MNNQVKSFLSSVLNTDLEEDVLLQAGSVLAPDLDENDIVFTTSLIRKTPLPGLLYFDQDQESSEKLFFRLRFYGGEVIRLLISSTPSRFIDESPMLAWDPSLQIRKSELHYAGEGWKAAGGESSYFSLESNAFAPRLSPDGQVDLSFQSQDHFVAHLWDSLPAFSLLKKDGTRRTGIALHIAPGEHFCGTGERFERPDLFGQQIDLVNLDAAGVNNPRAYKNIPLLLSSRGYGLFAHSAAKMRLDIGAHSTRSLQWVVEDEVFDLFIIGGGSPECILRNYRRITGFPPMPPDWSFGVWMSRCTYFSDVEVSEIAWRLRAEDYPTDVLHLDTGWFEKDWHCDWKFSAKNFPEPAGFLRRMVKQGFKVSLWQIPYVRPEIDLAETALEHGYVGNETEHSKRFWLGYTLDFTRPETTRWYQSLLAPLLEMGAAAIKTDFGEEIDEGAIYAGMSGAKYHNLFSLLYQKAAWEITEQVHGKGNAVIWARSGWAGSQRYPVHWGGDAAATYDGLAGTLCGGLHLGLSGFAFWSHDVGGIHGIPDFENSRPSEDLYVRWTQVGVFSSHIRYHGGTPREPWEFPAVADIVRQWLRFRYSLLPYILEQARISIRSGLPMLRSLIFDWPDDPAAWTISDQYLFGESLLICPVLNASGTRDVYLPEGRWVDFWNGALLSGPLHLKGLASPLSRLPIYVRYKSGITFAEPVQHTGLLPQASKILIQFDEGYPGFESCPLGDWLRFDPD